MLRFSKISQGYLSNIKILNNKFRKCNTISKYLSAQSLSADKSLPSNGSIVIIGGGIIGNSIAYHLGKLGVKDVVLLEQNQITSGTTWHAAGLMVTFGSLSETATEIRKYSKYLYSNLEKETGLATGFKPVGFIELATDQDRLEEYRRVSTFNRKCGVDVHEISPQEVEKLFPLCKTEDILAGFYVADDGRVNPVDVTMSLSKGAKMNGVQIIENARVDYVNESIVNGHRRVAGVTLTNGHVIQANKVVNCAGMWARQLGEKNGIVIPNQAAEHYYLITDEMKDVDPSWPVIEDPSSHTYIRPEGGGLMVGLFEPVAAAWNTKSIPHNFAFGEISPDWERMAPFVEKAMNRVPKTLTSGVKNFFCGPESFTPDLAPIVGEAPEVKGYFVAAGLNSIGILSGGGLGRAVAHWVAYGKPDVDVTGMNIDRFHKFQCNEKYRSARVVESLAQVYMCHYPYKSLQTARKSKRTPFYDRLKQLGAICKDVSGWEVSDWYGAGKENNLGMAINDDHATYTFGKPYFFENWRKEHLACREGVVLIDMSFMSKFLVIGRDAGDALNRLCTANINGPIDTITYTQMLNDDGKMEADITVCKVNSERFIVIATDTMHRHVETLLKRNLDPTGTKHVNSLDVTGGYAQLNIQGPKSRQVMELLTDTDMSDEKFPFRTAKEIDICYSRVLCARITYVGELGYELHIPCEHALDVFERINAISKDVGLVFAGLKALGSLRMEKGYRDYGHDMDNLDSLMEVGLGFTADLNKPNGFIGDKHVLEQKNELKLNKGLKRRLVQVLVKDPNPMMYHGEVIWRNNKRVGEIRAASYGHSLGGAIGLGMIELHHHSDSQDNSNNITTNSTTTNSNGDNQIVINKEYIDTGSWEVEIANKKYPVSVSLNPMYDPKNFKIKL